MVSGCRIRAEEFHPGLVGVQISQAVRDNFVGDVALKVDDEAIVAQTALGRA